MTRPQRTIRAYGRRPPKRAAALMLGPVADGHVAAAAAQRRLRHGVPGLADARQRRRRRLRRRHLGQPARPRLDRARHVDRLPDRRARSGSSTRRRTPTSTPTARSRPTGPGRRPTGAWTSRPRSSTSPAPEAPTASKAVAFAKVDYTNENELRLAHAIFGQVWYGVNVQRANQDEFSDGKPWNYVAGSPIEGGHSITGVGYDPTDYKFVTWAKETQWTEALPQPPGRGGVGRHLARAPGHQAVPDRHRPGQARRRLPGAHRTAAGDPAAVDAGQLAAVQQVRVAGVRRRAPPRGPAPPAASTTRPAALTT